MSSTFTVVELNSVERKLVALASQRKAQAEEAANREYADSVGHIPTMHKVPNGSHVEFGTEVPGGPIVMRVFAPPAPSKKAATVAPVPAKVRAGKRAKR